jgi:uncharacterized membrane protein YgdD (TMEM256/DUF423 family)
MKNFISLGALLAGLAVALGAFGAHGLKKILSDYEMGVYQTGVDYHFYHALALIGFGLFAKGQKAPNWVGWCFVFGVVVFSGSLYALALLKIPKLGMITPIGGLSFIIAWIGFALAASKGRED